MTIRNRSPQFATQNQFTCPFKSETFGGDFLFEPIGDHQVIADCMETGVVVPFWKRLIACLDRWRLAARFSLATRLPARGVPLVIRGLVA